MRKRYRYISSGITMGTDSIGIFRLIAGNMIKPSYNGKAVIRVNIPDDLKLEKSQCDPYSTTRDIRTLEELGYDILVWNEKKKRWKKHNEYKGTRPCDIPLEIKKEKPYSEEDYMVAKKEGLDLDNWRDYSKFYGLEY